MLDYMTCEQQRPGKMDVGTDDVIEIGGTWLSPDHSAALDLCRERLGT